MTNESTENDLPEPTPEQPAAKPEQPAVEPAITVDAPEQAAEMQEQPAAKMQEQPTTASPTQPPVETSEAKPAVPPTAGVEKPAAKKKPASDKKPAPAEKPAAKPAVRKKATPGALLSALGLMLLEILLPVILSSVLLWWIFATFNLWSYNRPLTIVLFAAGMVAFSLLISVMFDSALRRTRKSQRAAGVRFTSSPFTRLITLALGGIVLPLAVFGAANLVTFSAPLPTRGTVMNYIISSSLQPVKLAPPDEIGSIALETKDPAVKALSIQVLQGFKSAQALGQLVRLATDDKTALSDPSVADTLSTAIASYGKDARDPLIFLFKDVDPAQAGSTVPGDAYNLYFSGPFDELKSDVKASTLTPSDQTARLAEIDSAAAQLKTALKDIPAEKNTGDPRPAFALKTLLAMDLKDDPDLLSFAKSVADDRRYPASIRGNALLLIGKLGAKSDLDALYSYLKEPDTHIQTSALQAIANLQAKLNGAPPPQTPSQ